MLNSAEHEILSANKYKKCQQYLLAEKCSCSSIFRKKEFAFVSNLRFISRTNFMLSWTEHEKKCYNLGARLWQPQFCPCTFAVSSPHSYKVFLVPLPLLPQKYTYCHKILFKITTNYIIRENLDLMRTKIDQAHRCIPTVYFHRYFYNYDASKYSADIFLFPLGSISNRGG